MTFSVRIVSCIRVLIIAIGLQTCTTAWAAAQAAPMPGIHQVARIEGVTEYRLDNGLKVLLIPDASKPLITANLVYLVGSRHEGPGESGMAHLLEHMLFKGTPTTAEPKAEFTRRGMQWNGTTDIDRTNYYATFNAEGDNLNWYLGWLADAMVNSFVARRDLDSEMTVVRNEFERGEANFSGVLYQHMLSSAYRWHPYGKPTIGSRVDIENVSIASLQQFYRKYYQPDNAVLVVAGKIDADATLAVIAGAFGKIPKPARKLEPTYAQEPVQEGPRAVTLRRVGGVPVASVLYHSVSAGGRDAVTQAVLLSILNENPAGRIHKALIETGLATSQFAFSQDSQDPGSMTFGVLMSAKGDIAKVQKVLIDTLEALPPVKEEEVARAKTILLNATNRGMLDSNRLALSLTDEIALGDWRLAYAQRDWIGTVSVAEVNKLAHDYLIENNRTSGIYLPTPAPLRSPLAVRADTEKLLAGYQGKTAAAAVDTFDMSNDEIEKRTVKTTLPGGMKIATLMRPTKGDRITGVMAMHWGSLDQLKGKRGDAALLPAMMMKGTTALSRQELQDSLDRLDASLNVSASLSGANLGFSVPKENLAKLVGLMRGILRTPVFPQTEFDQAQRASITSIEYAQNNPNALAGIALSRHLTRYPDDDPRAAWSLSQSLDAIKAASLKRTKAFYETYASAARSELAVVGPVDPAEVAALFKNAFDDWGSKLPYARIPGNFQDIDAMRIVINTPDQANAVYVASQPLEMDEDHIDMPALFVAIHLVGGGSDSRLWKRVREKDGLSYGVGSGLGVSIVDKNGSIKISGTLAPQNRDKFEAAIKDELEQALKKGFSADEVAAAKDAILKSRRQSIAQEGTVAGILAGNLFWDRSFKMRETVDRRIAQMTSDEVNAALRKYVKPEKLTVVVAGDFEKK